MRLDFKLATVALAIAALTAAQDASFARAKHKVRHARHVPAQCLDRPATFSWDHLIFGKGAEPNGCAPPVYQYGRYVGQDPDPFIRLQLMRDPKTGSAADFH